MLLSQPNNIVTHFADITQVLDKVSKFNINSLYIAYVVYASREGYVESVYMRSLARAFVAH